MSNGFKSVVLVAREGLHARRKAGVFDQGKALPTEQDLLEFIALHLHEGRLRAVSAGDGAPFNPRTSRLAATDKTWMLSPDDRRKALELLRQHDWLEPEQEELLLEFTQPARPLEVPPELRALPPEQLVRVKASSNGRGSLSTSTAGNYIAQLEATVRRQADGFLTLWEAARDLEDAEMGVAKDWVKTLISAARIDAFPMHKPVTLKRVEYEGQATSTRNQRNVFSQWECAHVDDLNRWLDQCQGHVKFRFGRRTRSADQVAQRQERRYRACIDAGLTMPTDDYAHLPHGVKALARKEGISRQAFSEDLKAHIRRLSGK